MNSFWHLDTIESEYHEIIACGSCSVNQKLIDKLLYGMLKFVLIRLIYRNCSRRARILISHSTSTTYTITTLPATW